MNRLLMNDHCSGCAVCPDCQEKLEEIEVSRAACCVANEKEVARLSKALKETEKAGEDIRKKNCDLLEIKVAAVKLLEGAAYTLTWASESLLDNAAVHRDVKDVAQRIRGFLAMLKEK